MRIKKYFTLIFIFLSSIIFNTVGYSQNGYSILDKNKTALVSVWSVEKVFSVYTDNNNSEFIYDTTVISGSGFIIDERGYIATNYHVVQYIDSILIKTSDSVFYTAHIAAIDINNDLSILIIDNPDRKFPKVNIGDANNIKTGEPCYTIGSPLGYEYSISKGIVSGIRINKTINYGSQGDKVFAKLIQIDAAISPGNSGGALFNEEGEVIGIIAFAEGAIFYGTFGNLSFAVSVNSLTSLMTNLNETGIAGQEIQNIINISLCNKYLRKASMIKESIYDLKNPGVEINQDNTVNEIKSNNDSLISIQIKCAENLYDICLTLRPDTIIVYSELFDYYTTIKDSSRTEQTFEILCTKFKNDSLIYRKIYYDLLKKGESLTDKIKYDLKYDTNEKNKKTDSLKIIYTGEAEEYFRKCLRLNPDSTDAYKNLFDLYASTGNTDKISKFYSSLTSNLKEKINLTKYILNSAVKIIKDKKYDKALVLLNSLQKNDSLNNLTNYYKAYCFSRTNKFTNAEHLLDTIITCDSLAYWAYLELGYLYYNKEKYEKSESYLLKGLLYYMYDVRENAPEVFDYTDFYYYLGLIRIIKKDKCGAVLYYNMLFKCNDAKDKSIILFRKIQEI